MAQITNQVVIVGNLTADPELRYTQSGQPVANFTIASTPRSFDKSKNEWVDGEAVFQRASVWGKAAENLAASASKGARVVAVGTLRSRTFQDKDNNQRTAIELNVDEIGVSVMFAAYNRLAGNASRPEPTRESGGGYAAGDEEPW